MPQQQMQQQMTASPRYTRHQLQRNGSVPIAVAQVAAQQSFAPLSAGTWDVVHNAAWPHMAPADDPQDFRLHLARILCQRAARNAAAFGPAAPAATPQRYDGAASVSRTLAT